MCTHGRPLSFISILPLPHLLPPVPTALCSPHSSLLHALLTPSSSLHYPLSPVLPSSFLSLSHMHCLPSLPPFLTHAYCSASSYLSHSLLIHSSYCPLSCSLPHPLTTSSSICPCSSLTVSPSPLNKAMGHWSTFSLTHVFLISSSPFPYAFPVPSPPFTFTHCLLYTNIPALHSLISVHCPLSSIFLNLHVTVHQR